MGRVMRGNGGSCEALKSLIAAYHGDVNDRYKTADISGTVTIGLFISHHLHFWVPFRVSKTL